MSDVIRTSDAKELEAVLADGGVVALPTDTVYGLAALARRRDACDQIFDLKERPPGLALAVLVGDVDQADELSAQPRVLAAVAKFWPGPLTVVVRRVEGSGLLLGGDESTIGLRCPDHELVRHLAVRLGPLVVTSANRHGEAPATSVEEVVAAFGSKLSIVFDGGRCDGRPSTVVSLVDGDLDVLREGPIARSALEEALKQTS